MKCEDCKFADYSGEELFHFCRRNAPIPKMFESPVDGERVVDEALVWWPRVFCEDWCGEFKPKESEAA